MTDEEIRVLVRAAIAKHLGAAAAPPPSTLAPGVLVPISFARYGIPRPPEDVMCLIEPAVKCNHCGFCQCHGY